MLTKEQVLGIIGRTSYLDWEFHLGDMGNGFYVQVQFDAPDSETGKVERQHCRKWYISKHMTETEVVDTLYKAVEAAVIHEMKESFTYNGRMIHNPHTSVAARYEACVQTEHRAPPTVVADEKLKSQKSFLIDWDKVKYVSEEERAQPMPADKVTWLNSEDLLNDVPAATTKKIQAPKSIKDILDEARRVSQELERKNKLARMKAREELHYYGNRKSDPICDDCLCERKNER